MEQVVAAVAIACLAGVVVFLVIRSLELLGVKSQRRAAAQKLDPAAKKLDPLVATTRDYIEGLEQSRVFAPVVVPGLHLEQGEFVVRHGRATLGEWHRARVGGVRSAPIFLGTRVRVGRVPIYLGTRVRVGGVQDIPKEELRDVGAGELVLTNRRLLFLGAHTFAIPFARLLRCEQIDASLVVSESRWKNPRVLLPENPALWYFFVNLVANNRFEDSRLPDDVHLSVTGEAPNLRVLVTDSAPIKRGVLGTPSRQADGNQN
jgi:hypothetical protein